MPNKDEEAIKEDAQEVATESEVNKSEASPDVDWKAQYEKEKDRAENYKRAFHEKKEFVKKAPKVEETDEDEDKPLTRREFRSLLKEEVVPMVSASKEDQILQQKVSDPEKRKLVKFYLENRIKRIGTSEEELSQDINDAISMADGLRLTKENSELKRLAENKPSNTATAGSSADRGVEKKAYGWTPIQAQELEKKAASLKITDVEKFKTDAWNNRARTTIAR